MIPTVDYGCSLYPLTTGLRHDERTGACSCWKPKVTLEDKQNQLTYKSIRRPRPNSRCCSWRVLCMRAAGRRIPAGMHPEHHLTRAFCYCPCSVDIIRCIMACIACAYAHPLLPIVIRSSATAPACAHVVASCQARVTLRRAGMPTSFESCHKLDS